MSGKIILNGCKVIIVALFIFLIFDRPFENRTDIKLVRAWYKQKIRKNNASAFNRLAPNWNLVYHTETNTEYVYEIPLEPKSDTSTGVFTFVRRQFKAKRKDQDLRLLINRDKLNGEITSGGYMCLFRDSGTTNLKKIRYLDRGNFDGKIIYFNLNGVLRNGFILSKGKVVNQIRSPKHEVWSKTYLIRSTGEIFTTSQYLMKQRRCAGAGRNLLCNTFVLGKATLTIYFPA